jgi:hypothetical protein
MSSLPIRRNGRQLTDLVRCAANALRLLKEGRVAR